MNLLKYVENKIDQSEMHFLLAGNLGVENTFTNPTIWLSQKSWDEICFLDKLPNFQTIRKSFIDEKESWKAIYDKVSLIREISFLRLIILI